MILIEYMSLSSIIYWQYILLIENSMLHQHLTFFFNHFISWSLWTYRFPCLWISNNYWSPLSQHWILSTFLLRHLKILSALHDLRSFLPHIWCALNSTKILKCQGLSIKCWEWKNSIFDSLVPSQVFGVHSLVSTVPHSWLNRNYGSCRCSSKIQKHRMTKPILELYFMILYYFLDFSSMRLICLKSGNLGSKMQEKCHTLFTFRPSFPSLSLPLLYYIIYRHRYTHTILFDATFLYYFDYFFLINPNSHSN